MPYPVGHELALPARRTGVVARGSRWLVSEDLLELAARRLRVLGDPLRLRVLQSLATKSRSVGDLAELVGVGPPMISNISASTFALAS